jgi:hypothetical protein
MLRVRHRDVHRLSARSERRMLQGTGVCQHIADHIQQLEVVAKHRLADYELHAHQAL